MSTQLLSLSELVHVSTRAVENSHCLFYFTARIHALRKFYQLSQVNILWSQEITHHRLLVLLSELDMTSLLCSQASRNTFVFFIITYFYYYLFWGIRHYGLRLLDPTLMLFVMSWVPWIPWHHLLACPVILTVSFISLKLLVSPFVQNVPRLNFSSLLWSSFPYFFVFSCQLHQFLYLLFFPLTQICISCFYAIYVFSTSWVSPLDFSLLHAQVLKILSDHDSY